MYQKPTDARKQSTCFTFYKHILNMDHVMSIRDSFANAASSVLYMQWFKRWFNDDQSAARWMKNNIYTTKLPVI